jgi:hypothetical protein
MSEPVLMPEVDAALRRAVASRDGATAPARRRPWWTRRAGMLAIGAVVVSGSAVATTGVWQPTLGDPKHGGQPRAARTGVPASQLASLEVLRRPQSDVDRGPLVRAALARLTRGSINGVHVDAIRVVFRTPREIAVLIPAERVGPSAHPIRHALCLMSSSYNTARTIPITRHGRPATWRIPAGFTSWGMHCASTEDLRTTGIETGTTPDDRGGLVVDGRPARMLQHRIALVPDGVARVRVNLRGARTVTVPVKDNIYRYTITDSPAAMGTVWFAADGRRIDHRRRP